MQKVCNILSIVASVLVFSILGAGTFGYLWITNEENQERIKKELIEDLTGSLPIPKNLTGPAIPTAPVPSLR